MDSLLKKTLTVSRGFTYTYYITASRLSTSQVPFLFQHGWPDSHYVWSKLVDHPGISPNRIVVVDMLGYGESDKPREIEALAYDVVAKDMIEILDVENISRIISVGHDHGSIPAQRLYNFYPDRVAAIILFNVNYNLPNKTGPPFNIRAFNDWTLARFGYQLYEYWNFFALDPSACTLMNQNPERVWEACHAANMRELFCTRDAWKNHLSGTSMHKVTLNGYALDQDLKRKWLHAVSKGGFETPLNWYKAIVQDVQRQADQRVEDFNLVIRVPMLFIGANQDPVCRHDLLEDEDLTQFVTDYTKVIVNAGHWPMLEIPDVVGDVISKFLQDKLS